MNFFAKWSAIALVSGLVMACGGGEKAEDAKIEEADKVDGVLDGLGKLGEVAKDMEQAGKANEGRLKARRERGDTVAINYAELAKYLPDIDGYTREGGPAGETSNAMGIGMSNSKQRYVNGDKHIEVSIADFNSSSGLGAGALMSYTIAASISSESDDEKIVGFTKSENIKGSQVLRKLAKTAALNAVITDRFLITIEANEQNDLELVKKVFEGMDLNKLAEL
jgi:hypothetical protein